MATSTPKQSKRAGAGDGGAEAPEWELTLRSGTLRRRGIVLAVVVFAVHVIMAVLVGVGDTGVLITTADQWSFIVLGLCFAGACLLMLRPRLRIGAQGVEIRNLLSARLFEWPDVYGFTFPKKARCARLQIPADEFIPIWAIFIKDGEEAVTAMQQARKLEDQYMPIEA